MSPDLPPLTLSPCALSSPQEGKAEEVTWEDQQHICAFGRFNTRVHEVNAELRAKAVRARNQHLRRRFVGVEKKSSFSVVVALIVVAQNASL